MKVFSPSPDGLAIASRDGRIYKTCKSFVVIVTNLTTGKYTCHGFRHSSSQAPHRNRHDPAGGLALPCAWPITHGKQPRRYSWLSLLYGISTLFRDAERLPRRFIQSPRTMPHAAGLVAKARQHSATFLVRTDLPGPSRLYGQSTRPVGCRLPLEYGSIGV